MSVVAPSDGECPTNPKFACGQNGRCLETTSSNFIVCKCDSGYEQVSDPNSQPKQLCAKIDFCGRFSNEILCNSHGTCGPPMKPADLFECKCNEGYSGRYCEVFNDPCTLKAEPCMNGGECQFAPQIANIHYVCKCPLGFSGNFCETQKKVGLGGGGVALGPGMVVTLWGLMILGIMLMCYCLGIVILTCWRRRVNMLLGKPKQN